MKCYFCESAETLYCKICKKWMCDDCRKNYPTRIKAMLREKPRIMKNQTMQIRWKPHLIFGSKLQLME